MSRSLKQLYCFSLIAKFAICLLVPLVLDEYYYWFWGQNLQWSYFDHPPLVGWLMGVGDWFRFLGDGAIRWPFALLSHGTLYIWYLLTRDFFSAEKQYWFMVILLLNPMTGWGGITGTPDVPLLFFWSAALLAGLRLLKAPSLVNYLIFGALLGLGFLSKYIVVLFLPCLLLWIWWDKLWPFLLRPPVVGSILAGIIFCAPVLIWNLQNDWASFTFQWQHGTGGAAWSWRWPLAYLVGQILIVFPPFIWWAIAGKKSASWLASFALVPFIFFLMTSFFGKVEANWPVVAYPAVYGLALLNSGSFTWWGRIAAFWLATLAIVVSLPFVIPTGFSKRHKIKTLEAEVFQELIPEAKAADNLWANSYQMASYLSFHTGRKICKLPKIGRPDFFSFLADCQEPPVEFSYAYTRGEQPQFSPMYPQWHATHVLFHGNHFDIIKVEKK